MEHKSIAFIGAGNMTRSIINGMVAAGYPAEQIMATNRSESKLIELNEHLGIHVSQANEQAIEFADVIVLAVKPQMMEAVCEPLKALPAMADKVFISIAAGLTVTRLQEMLGGTYPIIRVMPNTPSLLGKGMSGLYAQNTVDESARQFANDIMQSVGKTQWVEQEDGINSIIAAAGSSPAYFFLFLEAMEKEAINMGFSQAQARELVATSMAGAAEMVCHNSHLELSELRAQVTSKGGTTAQAINHFQQKGLESIVSGAMQAAVTRAEEMAKQL